MSRTNRIIVLTAAVISFVVAAGLETASAQRKPKKRTERVVSKKTGQGKTTTRPRSARPKSGEKGAMAVFADIERAWNAGNVDLILKHYPRGKVTIVVEGSPNARGQYSRNQSHYVLKNLFKDTTTRKFEFTQYRKPGDTGSTSFAVAERRYQRRGDGRVIKDKIYVSLQAENGRWVVNEIKSIR